MKIAYDGTAFHGHARQPGLRTVEGEVIHALTRSRAIQDPKSSRLQSASRTDRGVSALGNVVAFDSELAPVPTAHAFNAKSRGVWAWAVADVAPTFSARRARERRYEYLLPGNHDERRLAEALRTFVGEHDFRNFTRDRERTVLRLDEAGARRVGETVVLEFRAKRFAWNLVRRLVAAALRVESGDASVRALERALQSGSHADFGLAPPEPLILVDVRYDIVFQPIRDPATHDRIRRLLAEQTREASFLRDLEARFREADVPDERLIGTRVARPMLIALTGTPGTGKSSVAEVLGRSGYFILYLDRFAEERNLITGVDESRGVREVDVEQLDREIRVPVKLGFLVSHYAHRMSVNTAIVLRCHPRTLADRLRTRGWPEAKIRENVEAEALDAITQEAVARGVPTFEVDTSSSTPTEAATAVLAILEGKTRGHEPGAIDWSDEVLSWS